MHIDYWAQPDAASRSLAEQHDDIDGRIARIEIGVERPQEVSLEALRLQRVALRENLDRRQRKVAGACCNCGRNCAGN